MLSKLLLIMVASAVYPIAADDTPTAPNNRAPIIITNGSQTTVLDWHNAAGISTPYVKLLKYAFSSSSDKKLLAFLCLSPTSGRPEVHVLERQTLHEILDKQISINFIVGLSHIPDQIQISSLTSSVYLLGFDSINGSFQTYLDTINLTTGDETRIKIDPIMHNSRICMTNAGLLVYEYTGCGLELLQGTTLHTVISPLLNFKNNGLRHNEYNWYEFVDKVGLFRIDSLGQVEYMADANLKLLPASKIYTSKEKISASLVVNEQGISKILLGLGADPNPSMTGFPMIDKLTELNLDPLSVAREILIDTPASRLIGVSDAQILLLTKKGYISTISLEGVKQEYVNKQPFNQAIMDASLLN